jgi:hypothetical protein
LNWQNNVLTVNPNTPFEFCGFQIFRYRGTSAVKMTASTARVVPVLANGSIFHTAIAPADTMSAVNTLGQPFYVTSELLDHDKGVELTAQTNQLIVNLKPDACVKITAS